MSQHWRDRAITASEVISDAFEVLKAWGARIAEWVLWFCLIANIIEIFPLPATFAAVFGGVVLGTQSVTLDIAGFGLTTMGDHARRRGDIASAKKATAMGWTLIGLMIVTVGLVTTSLLITQTKPIIDMIDKALILARVIVTVLYGHIVHSLRSAGGEHDNRVSTLEKQVGDVQKQLEAKAQEVSSVEKQLSAAQNVLSALRVQLSNEQETARVEIESLQGKLEIREREVQMMSADQSGIIDLRRELTTVKMQNEDLRVQLDAKQQALKNEQIITLSLRREIERLQQNEAKNEAVKHRSEAQRSTQTEAPKRSSEAKKRSTEAPVVPGIVRLPLNADRAALKAEALRLIDEEHLSTYQASERTKIPAGTIQRWLSERKNTAQLQMDGEAREA